VNARRRRPRGLLRALARYGTSTRNAPRRMRGAYRGDQTGMSAVGLAAHVAPRRAGRAGLLAEAKKPMTAKEMVDAMAEQGLWKSPGGKT